MRPFYVSLPARQGQSLNSSTKKEKMKVELNIIPENAIELLHIVAKLRDLDSSQKDSVPFMPDDPPVDDSSSAMPESEETERTPTVDEMTEVLRSFATEKGTDALVKILQSFGVIRFSELPEDKWLEAIKLTEQTSV